MTSRCTPCFNKKTSLIFVHSLICKCKPIFEILSLADLPENSPCTSYRNVRLTFTTLLPFVKFGADILSTPLSNRTWLRHMEHDAGLYFAFSVAALYSPDLNSVDNAVWETLQDCIYKNQIMDVEKLRQRVEEWSCLISEWLTATVREWRKRLQYCVAIDWWKFERAVWTSSTFSKSAVNISWKNYEVIRCIKYMFLISFIYDAAGRRWWFS